MNTRSALVACALLGVLVAVTDCAPRADSTVARPADVFPSVPEVRSEHRVVALTLDAVYDPARKRPQLAYRGAIGVVPTIRVWPGDTIDLTLRNRLVAHKNEIDAVNMHFHGLSVSPNAPADDSLMMLAQIGQVLHYHVKISDRQQPGLYWYHPHSHGEAYEQVTSGMSGALIVEGLQRHLPALASMRERVIVLRDVPRYAGRISDDDEPSTRSRLPSLVSSHNPCRAETTLVPTLNGVRYPNIGISPGERQFFRVVNASAARHFDLSIPGSRFQLVALDGVALDAYPGARPTLTVDHLVLPPAGRAEFVVTGPAHPTVFQSTCFDSGSAGDADPIATLANIVDPKNFGSAFGASRDASHDDEPIAVGSALPSAPSPLGSPVARRTIRFSEDANNFYINGKAFDMNAPPAETARAGTTEEWTILNQTDEVHDFHIHQIHFAAERIGGVNVRERHWVDTIVVPPRSGVTLLMDFRDPVIRGTFLYHCHILDHEDKGMMAKIRVI